MLDIIPICDKGLIIINNYYMGLPSLKFNLHAGIHSDEILNLKYNEKVPFVNKIVISNQGVRARISKGEHLNATGIGRWKNFFKKNI
jgi:hypothetical protein